MYKIIKIKPYYLEVVITADYQTRQVMRIKLKY